MRWNRNIYKEEHALFAKMAELQGKRVGRQVSYIVDCEDYRNEGELRFVTHEVVDGELVVVGVASYKGSVHVLSQAVSHDIKLLELFEFGAEGFWHLMADERPRDGKGRYVVVHSGGGMYCATEYEDGLFHVPWRTECVMEDDDVKAWAELPPLEV